MIASLGDRVRALRQDNAGPAAARNSAIAASGDQLFAFCDADDTWPDGKLHLQVGRLARRPRSSTWCSVTCSTSRTRAQVLPEVQYEDPDAKTLTHVHLGSGVYTRRAFEAVGMFDDTLRFSEDVDWFFSHPRARREDPHPS